MQGMKALVGTSMTNQPFFIGWNSGVGNTQTPVGDVRSPPAVDDSIVFRIAFGILFQGNSTVPGVAAVAVDTASAVTVVGVFVKHISPAPGGKDERGRDLHFSGVRKPGKCS